MTVTPTLIRWSRSSNRRRAVELAVQGAPWTVAGLAATVAAGQLAGAPATIVVGGGAAVGLAVAGWRQRRRVWHDPLSMALAVDRAHGTSDLLASALELEAGRGEAPTLAPLVLARAASAARELDGRAVLPLRPRIGAGGGVSALAAVALVFLLGATGHRFGDARADRPTPRPVAAATLDEEALRQAAEAAAAIARNRDASAEARAAAEHAQAALAKARSARSAADALGALSEAARALDKAQRALAAKKPPSAAEAAKLDDAALAEKLAEAARKADSEALAALAREALRRAATDPQTAAQLAEQLAKAAAAAAAAAKAGGQPDPEAERRLQKLAAAAARMAGGDNDGAKNELASLDRLSRTADPSAAASDASRQALEQAQRALSSMRGAQRDALNLDRDSAAAARAAMRAGQPQPGQGDQDARAAAARAGAGSSTGSGQMPGQGQLPGQGRAPAPGAMTAGGMAPGQMPGSPTGQPGAPASGEAPKAPATTGPDSAVSVRTGSGHSGHGPTGPKSPSGAGAPSAFSAEQVETGPAVTPEGAVRAIAERTAGLHQPTAFDRIADHYQAIAEAAIRKDDIPLTRRDYIQRYFAALRTREEP